MDLGPKTEAQVAASPRKCCATPEPAAPDTAPPGLPLPAVMHGAPRRGLPGPPLPDVMHGTPRPAPMLAAVSTAVDGPKRQKNALVRPGIEERLPQHVLEAVLGLLDRDTLCTARLVCKTFCAAASANISSLTCSSADPGVCPQLFPRLGNVMVHGGEESLAQLATGLRDIITTLKVSECGGFKVKTLAQIAAMPKLRELELHVHADMTDGIAALLRDSTSLQLIKLRGRSCGLFMAATTASITSVNGLSISRGCQPGTWAGHPLGRPVDESWLQQATALWGLQDLNIYTTSESLPLIANLASLTGLTWYGDSRDGNIDPLTRLTGLKSLCIRSDVAGRNLEIACSLGAGSLVSLDLSKLGLNGDVPDDLGRFLTCQTALARLTLQWDLCDLRQVRAVRVELLESLRLVALCHVDAEGLSALRKATKLTSLEIWFRHTDGDLEDDTDESDGDLEDNTEEEGEGEGGPWPAAHWLHALRLSQAIGGLTQLRALSLSYSSGEFPQRVRFMDYAQAAGPLTGLTQLELHSAGLTDGDLRGLLGLTGLRELEVSRSRLTDAVVPELSVLTHLKKLRLISRRVTSVMPLTEILDPLRHARGWPPVEWTFEVEE